MRSLGLMLITMRAPLAAFEQLVPLELVSPTPYTLHPNPNPKHSSCRSSWSALTLTLTLILTLTLSLTLT